MSARPMPRPPITAAIFARPAVFLRLLVLIGLVGLILYFFPLGTYWALWLSAIGWLGFSIYWGAAARHSAETQSAESAESRRVHLLLTNLGELLLFLPIVDLQQVLVPRVLIWVLAGLALQALAIGLAVWARRHLGGYWSGRIEIKADHVLIRSGPYRWLRHPIYTAVIGMCVGTAIVNGRAHALIGVVVAVGAYWRKIGMEEANMRRAFGASYEDYRRQTWGAIPGLF